MWVIILIIINDLNQLKIKNKTAIAIGKFDGIHKGHRLILDSILAQKQYGYKTLAFTFNPSPTAFFSGDKELSIMSLEEKRREFERIGVDILIEYPLNKESASIEPEKFITDILINSLNMGYIVAGEDLSFGKEGKGDFKLLESYSIEYGFEVHKINKIKLNSEIISSTAIKKALLEANLSKANNMLGGHYFLEGIVVDGKKLGRTLGFPTANVYPDVNKLLPLYGVYYTKVFIDNKIFNAITNIGVKPTVSNEEIPIAETYIYEFSDDIYGKLIRIDFCDYKRPERKYLDINELITALKSDINDGKKYFEKTAKCTKNKC